MLIRLKFFKLLLNSMEIGEKVYESRSANKVTFKVLKEGKIGYKTLQIKHNFEVIAPIEYDGQIFPETSVIDQLMEWLDNKDKSEMMIVHGWDMIIDYYPARKRKTRNDEIKEFLEIAIPYISDSIKRQFSATVYESKNILFGKGKSNITKFKEVCNIMKITNKAIVGFSEMLLNQIKQENTKERIKAE